MEFISKYLMYNFSFSKIQLKEKNTHNEQTKVPGDSCYNQWFTSGQWRWSFDLISRQLTSS